MRYRSLSPEGDYVFGQGSTEFLINSPAAVAQAVRTRLLLEAGEWYLDLTEGTPYSTQILGAGTQALYDQAFQERILDTPGVTTIDDYSSILDQNRRLSVSANISTLYGAAALTVVI